MYRQWYTKKYLTGEVPLLQSSGKFSQVFLSHKDLLSQKWTHYISFYDEICNEITEKIGNQVNFLELGIQNGGSLQIWRKILGSHALLFGIDSDNRCKNIDVDAEIRIGNISDIKFLTRVMLEMNRVDFVIDDASHDSMHQKIAFETIFPFLSDGGIYIIEDIEHSYHYSKHGGYLRPGSIVQRSKRLIDQINSDFFLIHPLKSFDVDVNHVKSITFQKGLIIIRKDFGVKPRIVWTGTKSL
jgi:hypothetical protein